MTIAERAGADTRYDILGEYVLALLGLIAGLMLICFVGFSFESTSPRGTTCTVERTVR